VLRRERERARLAGDIALVAELDRDYGYDAVDTCAADGMCQTACPVRIDTGALVKRLRSEHDKDLVATGWNTAAKHWGAVTRAGALALNAAKVLPVPLIAGPNIAARAVLGADNIPLYDRDLPRGGSKRQPLAAPDAVAVYVPSCIGSMFAPADGSQGVREAFLALCERAGVRILIPDGVDSLCCGTPWTSKGNRAGHRTMSETVLPVLLEATRNGELPVVSDGVSCTEGFLAMASASALTVIDAVEFVNTTVLPRLAVVAPLDSIAVHPTCSSTHLGVTDPMLALARAVSADVVVPDDWGCCAFAGDRGMLHPELTASATARESAEVNSRTFSAYASANRTCELGMTRATGRPYRHILELVDDATRR
jgi:D-lactate dehydrogenase